MADRQTEDSATSGDAANSKKSYREILAEEIREGLHEHRRSSPRLFLSGLSAGLDLGFSLLFMAIFLALARDTLSQPVQQLLLASLYSIGFIFVILGRSELFTEHTTLAVLPVLNRRASIGSLMRLWGLVYCGNILGATVFAVLAVTMTIPMDLAEPGVFREIAQPLVKHGWGPLLLSAILAGWLMGLLSWLVTAARDTVGQLIIIWVITAGIGFAHMPHSILGTIEVLAAVFAGTDITLADFGRFLLIASIGNGIGGIIFVAGVKYSHARPHRDGSPG